MTRFGSDLVRRARERAAETGPLPNTLSLDSSGTVIGYIGELCINEFLRSKRIFSEIRDSYEYDIWAGCAGCTGVRLEVKTMHVRREPCLVFTNPVLAKRRLQRADLYVFLRVLYDDSSELSGTSYFCGALPCAELQSKAVLCRPGDLVGGFPVRYACWNVEASRCLSWPELEAILLQRARGASHGHSLAAQLAARTTSTSLPADDATLPAVAAADAVPSTAVAAVVAAVDAGAVVSATGARRELGGSRAHVLQEPRQPREGPQVACIVRLDDVLATQGTRSATRRPGECGASLPVCKCRGGLMCYTCCTRKAGVPVMRT